MNNLSLDKEDAHAETTADVDRSLPVSLRILLLTLDLCLIVFYTSVLATLLYYKKDFGTPYYTILKGLSLADLTILITQGLNAAFSVTSDSTARVVLDFCDEAFGFGPLLCFHLLASTNRFMAIVCWRKWYKCVFNHRRTVWAVWCSYVTCFLAETCMYLTGYVYYNQYDQIRSGIVILYAFTAYTLAVGVSVVRIRKSLFVDEQRSKFVRETKMMVQCALTATLLISVQATYYGSHTYWLYLLVYVTCSGANPAICLTFDRTLRRDFLSALTALSYPIMHFCSTVPKSIIPDRLRVLISRRTTNRVKPIQTSCI